MFLPDYQLDELRFAYCYHCYLRFQTYRCQPQPPLTRLDLPTLQELAERFAIHVLEADCQPTDVRLLVSLRPEHSVAAAAGQLKGQISKWLRTAVGAEQPYRSLARGYFACTSGKSTGAQLDEYLQAQIEHHGYARRVLPPVHVQNYAPGEEAHLQPTHACTSVRFHLVLATWKRHGVFGPDEARAVADAWRALAQAERFALLKVSFVPDHAHVAVRTHPQVTPAALVVVLLNAAQRLLNERFADALIQARVERLWQASAYVGTFGELASPQIQQYLRNWTAQQQAEG